MATIRLDLTQFKHSGIYTLEFDASETIVLNTQTVRLIVGFSRKGPFNAPVYCPDPKTAERVYGKIDPFLERRGSYFHRALFTALDVGPVFGLNLMPLNNDEDFGDKIPYFSYSIAATEPNGKKVSRLYASFYNKERFWFPDQEYFLGNVNAPGSINTGKLFNIVNLGQNTVSIIVKKATVQGYNLTAREWYGAGNVPTYIDEWDLIEDYFLNLIIVAGDWTNYSKLSVDPVFSKYFDIRGLKKEKLQEFLGAAEVNTIGSFTGCIIPDFEQNGVNQSLETVINNALAGTGVFVAVDKKTLESYDPTAANSDDTDIVSAVDLIGHNFADPTRTNPDIVNFLSYKTVIKESLNFNLKTGFTESVQLNNSGDLFSTESVHNGKDYGYLDNVLVIPKPNLGSQSGELTELEYLSLKNLLTPGQSLMKMHSSDKYAIVQQIYEEDDAATGKTSMKILYSGDGKVVETTTPVGLSFTATYATGASYITILRPTDSTEAAYFDDWTHYPVVGSDLLLENKTTKNWYYAKVLSNPVFTYSGNTRISVQISVMDLSTNSGALSTLAASSAGFKAYFKSANRVQPYSVVFEDDYSSIPYSFTPTASGPTGFGYSLKVAAPANATALGATAYKLGTHLPGNGDKVLVALGTAGAAPNYYQYLTVSGTPIYWATAPGGATATSTASACLSIPISYSATGPEEFLFKEQWIGGATAPNYNLYYQTTTIDSIEEDLSVITKEQSSITFVYEPDKFVFVSPTGIADRITSTPANKFVAYKYNKLYKYFEDGALLPGDKYYYSPTKYFYLNYEKTVDNDGIPVIEVKAYDTFVEGVLGIDSTVSITSKTSALNINVTDNGGAEGGNFLRGGSVKDVEADGISTYVVADTLYDDIPVLSWNANKTEFSIRTEYNTQIQVGQYIVAQIKDSEGQSSYKLTKVLSKKRIYNAQLDSWSYTYGLNQPAYIFEPTDPDGKFYVTRYLPIDDFIKYYQLNSLEGFKITDYHLPGGNDPSGQLEKILGMINPQNSNLLTMLKSRDVITFRYVVDTFDGGLDPMTGAKRWLSRLAQQRQKCLALVNLPPIKDFIASTDPRFTELPTKVDPKPILNTRYIADGGNLSLGPSKIFSLVDETWGSKFVGYFGPFLTIRENGKSINIPPAAHVSNLFVQKFIKGQPYHIVAGPRRGVISEPKLLGLEYDFLDEDRDFLEPIGINPIIKKKGVGYMIYANQMAYQKTKSAFNNLHVRDLLITIEEAIEDILANYMFEFNDANTRLEIKTIVDGYLDGVRSAGGIYNYSVIMDDSNNPPEIIDQNMAVLDVKIEPARGIHKFVNRIQVFKTGGISSSTGGFTFA